VHCLLVFIDTAISPVLFLTSLLLKLKKTYEREGFERAMFSKASTEVWNENTCVCGKSSCGSDSNYHRLVG